MSLACKPIAMSTNIILFDDWLSTFNYLDFRRCKPYRRNKSWLSPNEIRRINGTPWTSAAKMKVVNIHFEDKKTPPSISPRRCVLLSRDSRAYHADESPGSAARSAKLSHWLQRTCKSTLSRSHTSTPTKLLSSNEYTPNRNRENEGWARGEAFAIP